MEDPIAFAASANPDVMYLDQAMKEPDKKQFEQAMVDEVTSHTENNHWEVTERSSIPKDTKILPSVWAMRRKRRISTGKVYKWKARLNLHGGKQEYGLNYWETYAPVISWTTIRLFLVLIECPMYMEIPRGFKFKGSRKTHCLLMKKNIYGQKQAGRMWNNFLREGLEARGFQRSKVDMCLYYRGKVSLLIYTDDGIFIGPTQGDIDAAYADLTSPAPGHKAFKMTDKGDLSDYLGVKVERLANGTIKLSQPHLIKQILDDQGINERTGTKPTPAASTVKLGRDIHGKAMDKDWHYRSVIGKLNFLEKSTRLNIAYYVHQCTRFSADPKESHASAVKRIGKYLLATKDKGLILNPREHSFECWVDADFVGNWDRVNADVDPSTAKSRTGYIITYAACPIIWSSKLQTEVTLSTTVSLYNAISASLQDDIFLTQIVKESRDIRFITFCRFQTPQCTLLEHHSLALPIPSLLINRPMTSPVLFTPHHLSNHV